MARMRSRLARLLALLLLLQWGTAFAHCLRPLAATAGGHGTEICTAEGFKAVLLDDEGRPVRKSAAGHAVCPVCRGPAALAPPTPLSAATPVVWAGEAPVRSPDEGLPVALVRAQPQQPRAPPAA